jgi:hypothetical protein
MAIFSHLEFWRGEDIVLFFDMLPTADITGWTITFKIAETLTATPSVTKTATVTDGARGLFKVTLASADTSSLTVGRWVWDARRIDTGFKTTLAAGTIELKREVTA